MKKKQHKPSQRELPWGLLQRLYFIEFRLFWDGRINRGDLIDTFGVSVPQASLDFREYMERAPGNMDYDKSQKFYFAARTFKAIFIDLTAESYFDQLTTGDISKVRAGHRKNYKDNPVFDVMPSPERWIDAATLRTIIQAINAKMAVEIKYQSVSTELAGWRWVEPHALASDGMRWHMRSYCWHRKEFRDFVLGRIIEVRGGRAAEIPSANDLEWDEHVRVVIAANPGLAQGQREIIERDYAMESGKAEIVVRRALLFYLKRRLGVDNAADKSPNAQQVVIVEIIPI